MHSWCWQARALAFRAAAPPRFICGTAPSLRIELPQASEIENMKDQVMAVAVFLM